MAAVVLDSTSCVNIGKGKETYTLTEKVGQGAYGEVYKATKKSDGRIYAIKKLGDNMSNVDAEITCCTKLSDHDNVVKYFGYLSNSGDNKFWLILEFCELGTLSRYILSHECDTKMLLRFGENMANGLKFLHKNKIVHRDLKPDNILVTTNRKGSTVCKITDFSIAVCMEGLQSYYLSSWAGIPYFTAPEVWSSRYTETADIFSLGLVIFAMFTRSRLKFSEKETLIPYVEINNKPQPIGLAINFDKITAIEVMVKTAFKFLERLGELILKMLNVEPKARPKAAAVHDQVKKIQIGDSSCTLERALASALTVARSVDELFKPTRISFGEVPIVTADSGVSDLSAPFLIHIDTTIMTLTSN